MCVTRICKVEAKGAKFDNANILWRMSKIRRGQGEKLMEGHRAEFKRNVYNNIRAVNLQLTAQWKFMIKRVYPMFHSYRNESSLIHVCLGFYKYQPMAMMCPVKGQHEIKVLLAL